MALEYGHLTVFTSSTHPFIPLPQPLPPHHHRRNLVSRAFTTFHHLLYSDFILRRLEQKSAASVLHPFFTSSRHPHARDIFHLNSRDTKYGRTKNGPESANNEQQEKSNLESITANGFARGHWLCSSEQPTAPLLLHLHHSLPPYPPSAFSLSFSHLLEVHCAGSLRKNPFLIEIFFSPQFLLLFPLLITLLDYPYRLFFFLVT